MRSNLDLSYILVSMFDHCGSRRTLEHPRLKLLQICYLQAMVFPSRPFSIDTIVPEQSLFSPSESKWLKVAFVMRITQNTVGGEWPSRDR